MKKILIFLILFVAVGVGIVYAVTALTVTDSFTDTTKIASSVNVTVDTVNGRVFLAPQSTWTCGSLLVDSRDGKSYATVLIGTQCWMQQNLNVGTMINGTTTQGVSTTSVQKYCYDNNEGNCTTYGALYQWNQAMGNSVTEGARGICMAGWHIPTHNDWTLLERNTCTSGTCATDFPYDNSTIGYRGTYESLTLRSSSGLFKAEVLPGYRTDSGTFSNIGNAVGFTSSSVIDNSYAWVHGWTSQTGYGGSGVARTKTSQTLTAGFYIYAIRTYGNTVRCLKD